MLPGRSCRVWGAVLGAALVCWGNFGCGLRPGSAQAEPQGDAADGAADKKNGEGYKSRIARALNGAFNELSGEGTDEERELIRQSLDQNDEELARVLESNPREAILRANQRLPEVVIEPRLLAPPATEPAEPAAPSPEAGDQK